MRWLLIIVLPILLILLIILVRFYNQTSPPTLKMISTYTGLPSYDNALSDYRLLSQELTHLNSSISSLTIEKNNLIIEVDTLRAKIRLVSGS